MSTYRDVLYAVMQRRIRHPNDQTDAEIAAGVTPVNYAIDTTEYGDVRRYKSNSVPGTTDMASAIQAAYDTGGSGPATAGQNTWAKFVDSAGNAFYVPVWK